MASSGAVTLGQLAETSEAALFVGRGAALRAVRAALEEAPSRPSLFYVHGPQGAGKSAFLRVCRRLAEEASLPSALIAAEPPEEGKGGARGLLEALATALDLEPGSLPPSREAGAERLAAALEMAAAGRGFALLVDDYDRLGPEEDQLRERFLARVGAGVCVLLAGRRPPAELWPASAGWLLTVRDLPLGGLDEEDVARLLGRLGLDDPEQAREVHAVSGGHPALLVQLARQLIGARAGTAAPRPAGWTGGGSGRRAASLGAFLIERWLHPGTRRRSWRAGGSGLDDAVGAAALLPFFDRLRLRAAVGEPAVEAAWPVLEQVARPAPGGGLELPEPLRERIVALVRGHRPWSELRWRRKLIRHVVERAALERRGAESAWPLLAELAQEADWHAPLHPAGETAEGWQVEEGAGCPLGCAAARTGRACLQARGARGEVLACLTAWVPPRRPESLVVHDAHEAPAGAGALGMLLRHLAGGFHACGEVVVGAPALARARTPAGRPLLAALGFAPAGAAGVTGDAAAKVWRLDLRGRGYAAWLRELAPQPQGPLLPPERWAAAAKEALLALDRPELLTESEVGRALLARQTAPDGPARVRAWLLDALRSAELDDPHASVSARRLVQLYYVERLGSHEAVAERLNVSRATYFRCHREALRRLGEALSAQG
ncbi:MAG: ATP-binding protein [Bacillota bacterium]|nr:ATP-binding protein [Bacillota bacterium]